MSTLHSYTEVFDAIAAAIPERECLVQGRIRRTWADVLARTQDLARGFATLGIGLQDDPEPCSPWVSPHDQVGLLLRNCPEHLEAVLGAYRSRCAPFNINFRYQSEEVRYLLDDADARLVVYHLEFANVLDEALKVWPGSQPLLVHVEDGSAGRPLSGSHAFEEVLGRAESTTRLPRPSPDDLHILYTGGTTGMPKGVIWCQKDVLAGPCGLPDLPLQEIVARAERRDWLRSMPLPPLIHGTGLWFALTAWVNGGTIVLSSSPGHFDPVEAVETCRQEEVSSLAVVGDAFVKPMLDVLSAESSADLPKLRTVFSSGAALSAATCAQIAGTLPKVKVINALGSSESGPQAVGSADGESFTPGEGTVVLNDAMDRVRSNSDPGPGWLASAGPLPRGYLGDATRTNRTYRIVEGDRYVVSGDRAEVDDQGQLRLLGRSSVVINTGGEKVYTEEVEAVIRSIPGVRDALVVGRPSTKWGEAVVALVVSDAREPVDADALRGGCAVHLAGYKVPKEYVAVDEIVRFENGKPDYQWARQVAARASTEEGEP